MLLFVSSLTFAQKAYVDVAISASTVSDADAFTYRITTDCDCDIESPDLSNFDILQKQPGQSHATSSINGVSKSSCTSTLTYVLKAKKKGKFSINEAIVHCSNADRQSEKVSIEVVDAGEAFKEKEGKDDFYYKITSNKDRVIAGEPFIVNFFLYSTKKPRDIMAINSGSANGAWRQNLFQETASNFAFQMGQESVKGKLYYVIYLRKEVCIANTPGMLKIEPYFGRAVENYDYMGSTYFEGFSNDLDIEVINPPVSLPEDYYGMVGDFELKHEISKTKTKANRAIELKLTISGSGNFNQFQDPSFSFPESFLVSDPEYEESIEVNENGIEGSITYTFIITPTEKGDFTILPYGFSFYSLAQDKIKHVSTQEFTLKVSEGEEVKIISDAQDPQIIEDDIRFIHGDANTLFTLNDLFFGRLGYYALLLSPILIAFIFILVRRKKGQLSPELLQVADQNLVKKTAQKDLRQLKKQAQGSDDKSSTKQVKATLDDYLMRNLSIGRSALGKKHVAQLLQDKGLDAQLIEEFNAIWDKLELAQFAPLNRDKSTELIDRTASFLKSIKNKI